MKEWGGEGLGGNGGFSPSGILSGSPSRLEGLSEDSSNEGRRLLAGRGSELVWAIGGWVRGVLVGGWEAGSWCRTGRELALIRWRSSASLA